MRATCTFIEQDWAERDPRDRGNQGEHSSLNIENHSIASPSDVTRIDHNLLPIPSLPSPPSSALYLPKDHPTSSLEITFNSKLTYGSKSLALLAFCHSHVARLQHQRSQPLASPLPLGLCSAEREAVELQASAPQQASPCKPPLAPWGCCITQFFIPCWPPAGSSSSCSQSFSSLQAHTPTPTS